LDNLCKEVGPAACPDCARATCPSCEPPPPCNIPNCCMQPACCDADFNMGFERSTESTAARPAAGNKRARQDDSCNIQRSCQHGRQQYTGPARLDDYSMRSAQYQQQHVPGCRSHRCQQQQHYVEPATKRMRLDDSAQQQYGGCNKHQGQQHQCRCQRY
jgi:hypothetical protein